MDADILQAIRIIDDKIASLQEARDRLASAFGINGNLNASIYGSGNLAAHLERTANSNPLTAPVRGTRKTQLAQMLMERGPSSRVTISNSFGIPEGTVSYCLNDKKLFEQNEKGDWDITESCRKALLQRAKSGLFEME
jgi:hypothetical protein